MGRRLNRLILLVFVMLLPIRAEAALRKVALVIANGNYANGGNLRNPINDAKLVSEALQADGFASVAVYADLNRIGFERALRDYKAIASTADIAVIYYAGHGIEEEGKNWMIPVDAGLGSAEDLRIEAVDLDRILDTIRLAKVRMVVLDACRNNPFARSWTRTTRSEATAGLGMLQLDDYLVIYAAAPGQTATDGTGANSPFATSFARRLTQQDLPIQLLGNAVRDDVRAATGRVQSPFVSASITSTPIFLAADESGGFSGSGTVTADVLDALGWQGALRANTREAYAAYQDQFPRGRFRKLASQNVRRLAFDSPAPRQIVVPATATSAPADEKAGVTALLNQTVQSHNDAIMDRHRVDMDQYRQQVAEIARTSESLQQTYLQKIADFKVEEAKWQQRAIACRNRTADCGQSAEIRDERTTWREGVTICRPSDAGAGASDCEGPMATGTAVIGTAAGLRLLRRTCAGEHLVRDLGTVNGARIFGCGYGINPEDSAGARKGNLDLAKKFGLDAIPGRLTFRCARKTERFCETS